MFLESQRAEALKLALDARSELLQNKLPVSNMLRISKTILTMLGKENEHSWIRLEIDGYREAYRTWDELIDNLPMYRRVACSYLDENRNLVTIGLAVDPAAHELMKSYPLDNSIAELESCVDTGIFVTNIPTIPILREKFGIPVFQARISQIAIRRVLEAVKTRIQELLEKVISELESEKTISGFPIGRDTKLLLGIFRLFSTRDAEVFSSKDIYEKERQKLGITEVTEEQIRKTLRVLQDRNLVTPVPSTDAFRITESSKSRIPEDLLWDERKTQYEKLLVKNASGQKWVNRERVLLIFLTISFLAMLISWGIPLGRELIFNIETRYILGLVTTVLLFLGSIFVKHMQKFDLSYEEHVFLGMWHIYGMLRTYESSKAPEVLKTSIGELENAASILEYRKSESYWEMIENQVFGALRKVSSYIKGEVIPCVRERKIRDVLHTILIIGLLFKDGNIPNLLSFAQNLRVEEPPPLKMWERLRRNVWIYRTVGTAAILLIAAMVDYVIYYLATSVIRLEANEIFITVVVAYFAIVAALAQLKKFTTELGR